MSVFRLVRDDGTSLGNWWPTYESALKSSVRKQLAFTWPDAKGHWKIYLNVGVRVEERA
jgi:hypothetical protein